MRHKVKANHFYTVQKVMLDIIDPRADVENGDTVKVVNLHGCPKANTMGMCHIYKNDRFVGLIYTNSLIEIDRRA